MMRAHSSRSSMTTPSQYYYALSSHSNSSRAMFDDADTDADTDQHVWIIILHYIHYIAIYFQAKAG